MMIRQFRVKEKEGNVGKHEQSLQFGPKTRRSKLEVNASQVVFMTDKELTGSERICNLRIIGLFDAIGQCITSVYDCQGIDRIT